MSDPPLEEQIRQFLARLPPPGPVWEELRPCKGQLFCGLFLQFWNRECHLSPELLLEVARRHISLRLDIYFEREEPDFSEDAE